jgi:excinuclease UvrABC nuclease subunit
MFNPSAIELKSLPAIALEEKAKLPPHPGIYFAIDSLGTVQYIGLAINVRNRWNNHHRFNQLKLIGGVRIAYLYVDAPELLPEIETALIQHFQPLLNFTHIEENNRINLKLNFNIRKQVKTQANLNNRRESGQIERMVVELEALKRVLRQYPEIAALFLPKFNEELPKVAQEITDVDEISRTFNSDTTDIG